VKIFCTAVGQSIGMSIEEVIAKFDRSYWDIGGTPINAIMTIAFCAENGFFICKIKLCSKMYDQRCKILIEHIL